MATETVGPQGICEAVRQADFMAGVARAADLFDLVMGANDPAGFLEANVRDGAPLSLIAAPALRELLRHPEQIEGFAAALGDWLTCAGQGLTLEQDASDIRGLSYAQIVGQPSARSA